MTAVAKGGSQTYTITPNAGYKVLNVTVGGVSVGTPTSYTFSNVQIDQKIVATFTLETYTVAATTGANGTISPTGTRPYNKGTSVTYWIMPDIDYVVDDVLVDGVSVGAKTKYVFPTNTDITIAHSISATFKPKL